jgi:hypothetical protein
MIRSRLAALVLLLALPAACARPRLPHPPAMSGFLDDYSLLRAGGPDEVALVYRDPAAQWTAYDKVLLEPVTLWRSGKGSLDPVPPEDLLRLVATFDGAVRRRLEEGFALVGEPGPGVLRIRLGITEARATDPVLDVLTAAPEDAPHLEGDAPLHPETRRFVAAAAIEGDVRDARTGALLAAGVDRRREGAPPLETWGAVERALAFWADRVCTRLEARTRPR